jgi:hypothetical protein
MRGFNTVGRDYSAKGQSMSRMLWNCRVVLTGTNGQSGTVDLSATNLVTIREIEAFLAKATKLASMMHHAPVEEMEQPTTRPAFKVV